MGFGANYYYVLFFREKVGHVLFHPTADNVLASASADFTIKIWDVSKAAEKLELLGHSEIIQCLDWNYDGSLMVTTCKDKRLRLFDVRSKTVVQVIFFINQDCFE